LCYAARAIVPQAEFWRDHGPAQSTLWKPDGTVRLTISNRADFPGAWNRGKEYPRPDRREAAGMLFMSEEGTELGGLIWGRRPASRWQYPESCPSQFR